MNQRECIELVLREIKSNFPAGFERAGVITADVPVYGFNQLYDHLGSVPRLVVLPSQVEWSQRRGNLPGMRIAVDVVVFANNKVGFEEIENIVDGFEQLADYFLSENFNAIVPCGDWIESIGTVEGADSVYDIDSINQTGTPFISGVRMMFTIEREGVF